MGTQRGTAGSDHSGPAAPLLPALGVRRPLVTLIIIIIITSNCPLENRRNGTHMTRMSSSAVPTGWRRIVAHLLTLTIQEPRAM